jgi:mono/diheme cytochrome c family protein
MGDVAKVNCATCHQGAYKPLYGASMLKCLLRQHRLRLRHLRLLRRNKRRLRARSMAF